MNVTRSVEERSSKPGIGAVELITLDARIGASDVATYMIPDAIGPWYATRTAAFRLSISDGFALVTSHTAIATPFVISSGRMPTVSPLITAVVVGLRGAHGPAPALSVATSTAVLAKSCESWPTW